MWVSEKVRFAERREVAVAATIHRLLGLRSLGPTAVSASLIRRFVLCFCLGSGVASGDCASGATGSAVPLITFSPNHVFAASLARAASYLAQRIESRVQLLIGSRGSRERHGLGTSLNHIRRRLTPRQQVSQRLQRRIKFFIGHRLDDAA